MSDDTIQLDTKNLEKFIKALVGNSSRARVGVLGDKNSRSNSQGTSNASIGAIHEFGQGNIPQRSFLRVPITDHLQEKLESAGAFTEGTIKQVIKDGSFTPWLTTLGLIGETIVSECFEQQGEGKWPAHSPGYKNNTGMILQDTQQLRNSITSDVV